jgi:hypothetical protein
MSCATESYAPTTVDPDTSLCVLAYSGDVTRPSFTEREIHHASPLASDRSRLTASRVVPDTTRADPEHIWGDEGPINK